MTAVHDEIEYVCVAKNLNRMPHQRIGRPCGTRRHGLSCAMPPFIHSDHVYCTRSNRRRRVSDAGAVQWM
jgi:hypothetical protein